MQRVSDADTAGRKKVEPTLGRSPGPLLAS